MTIRYQVLATDMDGTLLKNDKTISQENLSAIHRGVKAGLEFIICTGRPFSSTEPYLRSLKFPCWVVTNNGAVIRNKAREVQKIIHLKPQTAMDALKIIEEEKLYYHGADDLHLYISSLSSRISFYSMLLKVQGVSPWKAYFKGTWDVFVRYSHKIVDLPKAIAQGQKITSLFLYDDDPKRLMAVKERLGKIPDLQITSSGENNLELLDPKATKGAALQWVTEAIGVPQEAVVAVGDQLNDLSMINFAGLGVAMGNGAEPVLQAADFVTKTNEEHGISYLIEEKILSTKKEAAI